MEYILVTISTSEPVVPEKITNSDLESNTFPPDLTHKGRQWYPLVRDAKPAFDAATEVVEPNHGIVVSDYVFGWTKRNMTQPELDAYAAAIESRKEIQTDDIVIGALGKILFRIVNDVRVLQVQPTLTAGQFRAWVRSQLDV